MTVTSVDRSKAAIIVGTLSDHVLQESLKAEIAQALAYERETGMQAAIPALIRRLIERAQTELSTGTVSIEGRSWRIVSLAEVQDWLAGVAIRIGNGEQL